MSEDDFDLRFPLDEGAGPAAPIAPEHANAMIAAAIDRVHEDRKVHILRPRRRYWVLALVAAIVLVMGSALAAILPRVLHSSAPPAIVPPIETTQTATTAIAATAQPTAEIVASSEPEVVATPSASIKEVAILPADLLRTANEQRAQRKWSDAQATYQRVTTRSPHTMEAYTATVAAASIRLEHLNDASGALRLYQSALADRPTGALSEEARWGIAEARRALGDQPGEIEALRAFVTNHPDAIMRPSADARLRELHAK